MENDPLRQHARPRHVRQSPLFLTVRLSADRPAKLTRESLSLSASGNISAMRFLAKVCGPCQAPLISPMLWSDVCFLQLSYWRIRGQLKKTTHGYKLDRFGR